MSDIAINIINGFSLGNSVPIDYRIVSADASERIAIVHKYDGLKVFQRDTREQFIWNANSSTWDSDSGGTLVGNGIPTYVPLWGSTTGLTNSNIYVTSSMVGINTTDPKGFLQINHPTILNSNPLVFHKGTDSYMAYNAYEVGATAYVFSQTEGSGKIRFTNNGTIKFETRDINAAASSYTTNLELNTNISGRIFNKLKSPNIGYNMFVGTSSFTSTVDATISERSKDLLSIGGSFRTNSNVSKKLKHVTFEYSTGIVTGYKFRTVGVSPSPQSALTISIIWDNSLFASIIDPLAVVPFYKIKVKLL